MPVPDKQDVKRFCELDGWEETEPNSPDHHRYRKRLDDGTVLRTKVSHGRGAVCHTPALWANIWRHQLGLNSEEEFWEVLKAREPVQRTEREAPPREPQMPTWLYEALVHTWGMDEDEVRRMSKDDALARYIALCEGGGEQPR